MTSYKIRSRYGDFVVESVVGTGLFLLIGLQPSIHAFLKLIGFIVVIRFFFYRSIDRIFPRIIRMKNDRLTISFLWFRLPIDSNDGFTIIEDHQFMSPRDQPVYFLVLVRNNKGFFSKLFRNRIRLYGQDGKLDLEGIGNKIETTVGIRFAGILPSLYSDFDDLASIRNNKGIIP